MTREQVVKLANYYKVTEEELLTLWLSDKVLETIDKDPFAMQGLNKAKTILKKALINPIKNGVLESWRA